MMKTLYRPHYDSVATAATVKLPLVPSLLSRCYVSQITGMHYSYASSSKQNQYAHPSHWTNDGAHISFVESNDGDVCEIDLAGGALRDLTKGLGAHHSFLRVLVLSNDDDRSPWQCTNSNVSLDGKWLAFMVTLRTDEPGYGRGLGLLDLTAWEASLKAQEWNAPAVIW